MTNFEENLNEQEALRAELFEKQRIEEFLRTENRDLWKYISNIKSLPLFGKAIYVLQKIDFFVKFFSKPKTRSLSKLDDQISKTSIQSLETKILDVLFVLTNNKVEIGGIQTSVKLAEDLSESGLVVNITSINFDPTAENHNLYIPSPAIENLSSIKTIVSCGAETVLFTNAIVEKFNAKSILLMLGADHYFTPLWKDAKNFIKAIETYDFIIALSPLLQKVAKSLGAKNIVCAPLGFDNKVFNFEKITKSNQIVINCRESTEKGLRFLLPQIPNLRKMGWRVVGFGDVKDPKFAEVFDYFYGRLNKREIYELLLKSKILLDASFIEGLGLVALEAAASGCVPIITRRHDYHDLFEDNKLPYIEIDNFIDPNIVLSAIEEAKKLKPEDVVENVKNVNWVNGSKIIQDSIRNLLN